MEEDCKCGHTHEIHKHYRYSTYFTYCAQRVSPDGEPVEYCACPRYQKKFRWFWQ